MGCVGVQPGVQGLGVVWFASGEVGSMLGVKRVRRGVGVIGWYRGSIGYWSGVVLGPGFRSLWCMGEVGVNWAKGYGV